MNSLRILNMNIPTDFRPLSLKTNPYIDINGPLYGRWAENRFTLGFRVEERHCNPGLTCHGGMLSTLADMTLLYGCNLQGKIHQYLLTITLTTDFLGPAHAGDWIEGRCDVLRASKNMVFAQGLLQVEDRLVARINGIFKPTGEPNSHKGVAHQFGLAV
jgi:uncharacterized protein (TIGR00369 family)